MALNNSGPQASASRVIADGAFKKIPGFIGTDRGLDEHAFLIPSGLLNLHTATTASGYFMVPFDASIVAALVAVVEQAGTGPGLVLAGKTGDLDFYIDDYSIGTSVTVGLYDITSNAAVVNTTITAGETVIFSTDGGATTTGLAHVTLVCVPRL